MSTRQEGSIKLIELSGTAYERGLQYGEEVKESINRLVNYLWGLLKKKGLSKNQVLACVRKHIPYIEEYSKEIAKELKGIAKGSGRMYEEIILESMHEEISAFTTSGCTAFAATGQATLKGETYLGQNWDESMEPDFYWNGNMPILRSVRPDSGPSYLAWAYPGQLAGAGLNANGIGLSWNSVQRLEFKVGVPTYLIIPEILRQKTIGDALGAIMKASRAGCFSFFLCDETEICNIEATPSDVDIYAPPKYLAHANHYVLKKFYSKQDMSKIEEYRQASSFIRQERMNRLLHNNCGNIDLKVCQGFLADHVNYPDSICCHPNPEISDKGITWNSWVMVPAKREWWIAHGNPCKNEFKKYEV